MRGCIFYPLQLCQVEKPCLVTYFIEFYPGYPKKQTFICYCKFSLNLLNVFSSLFFLEEMFKCWSFKTCSSTYPYTKYHNF